MERVWTISCLKGTNKVALGYDDGSVMVKLGHEEPVMSMERGGKVVFANNNDVVIANLKLCDFKDVQEFMAELKDLLKAKDAPEPKSRTAKT